MQKQKSRFFNIEKILNDVSGELSSEGVLIRPENWNQTDNIKSKHFYKKNDFQPESTYYQPLKILSDGVIFQDIENDVGHIKIESGKSDPDAISSGTYEILELQIKIPDYRKMNIKILATQEENSAVEYKPILHVKGYFGIGWFKSDFEKKFLLKQFTNMN